MCSQTFVLIGKIRMRRRAVRIATIHLCPPRVPWRDRNLQEVGVWPGTIRDWLGSVRAYEYARRSQIGLLRLIASGGVEPMILTGDLNTTSHSLDMAQLLGTMKSAFDERGFGFTIASGPYKVRVDHVLYTEGLRARSAAVPDVRVSNHKPLETVLEFFP